MATSDIINSVIASLPLILLVVAVVSLDSQTAIDEVLQLVVALTLLTAGAKVMEVPLLPSVMVLGQVGHGRHC